MPVHYTVILEDPDGNYLRTVTDIVRVTAARSVNNLGAGSLVIPDQFAIGFFRRNMRLRIYRAPEGGRPALVGNTLWFLRSWELDDEAGRWTLTFFDNLMLLKNMLIAYPSETIYADKTIEEGTDDYADNLIKAYVRENGGSLTDNPLRQYTNFTVEYDTTQGLHTEKQASYANLLDTCRELADASAAKGVPIYFDIVYREAQNDFFFFTRANYLGSDRTSHMVFSRGNGNLHNITLNWNYEDEITAMYVGGDGDGAGRLIATLVNSDAIRTGPFARIEGFEDAGDAFEDPVIEEAGRAALHKATPRLTMIGEIIESPLTHFGEDYNYGDQVLAEARGMAFTAHVDAFSLQYENPNETLDVKLTSIVNQDISSGLGVETVGENVTVETPYDPIPDTPAALVNGEMNNNLTSTTEKVVAISIEGYAYRTTNFQNATPTWDEVTLSVTETGATVVYGFVVNPFSPLYIGTGTKVNGWLTTQKRIWYVEDLFGSPSATIQHTFPNTAYGTATVHRTINASFGRFNAADAGNPWVMVVSYYKEAGVANGATTAVYSQDGGVTWSSEIEISTHVNTAATLNSFNDASLALHLSPKTAGLAYVTAYTSTGSFPTADGFVTTDWGATWTAMTDPDIQPGTFFGGTLHVPWPTNPTENIVYHSHAAVASGDITYTLKRVAATVITDISPTNAGLTYGTSQGLHKLRTYDGDRNYVVLAGTAFDGATDTAYYAIFVSDDAGDTWTMIESPKDEGDFFGIGGWQVAFANDTEDSIFIWGGQPGDSLVIAYSDDFGATTQNKLGNLETSFFDVNSRPRGLIAIAGGDA